MQSKLKTNKRIIDENEEEITQLKNKNRKITRDIDELNEQNEILNMEIAQLRQKHRWVSSSILGGCLGNFVFLGRLIALNADSDWFANQIDSKSMIAYLLSYFILPIDSNHSSKTP